MLQSSNFSSAAGGFPLDDDLKQGGALSQNLWIETANRWNFHHQLLIVPTPQQSLQLKGLSYDLR